MKRTNIVNLGKKSSLISVFIQGLRVRRFAKGSATHIPLDKLHPFLQSKLLPDPWLGPDLYLRPRGSLAQILKREIGSFFQRIRWLLETELYLRGVWIGFQCPLGLTRKESIRAASGYSEDSHSLYTQFPWMTLVDERISVEAWTMGAAWAYRNARSESISLGRVAFDDPKTMLLYDKLNWRWDCTSKTPKPSTVTALEVPETSKRDLQSQLPSQELPVRSGESE